MSTAIHTFNTGRPYSRHGQRIAYTVIKREPDPDEPGQILQLEWVTVAFLDADRMVDGVLTFLLLEGGEPSAEQVLAAYDGGRYTRWPVDLRTESLLRTAALSEVLAEDLSAQGAQVQP